MNDSVEKQEEQNQYTTQEQIVKWKIENYDGKENEYKSETFLFQGYSVNLYMKFINDKPVFGYYFTGLPENTYILTKATLYDSSLDKGIQGQVPIIIKPHMKNTELTMELTKKDLTDHSKWLRDGALNFTFQCQAFGDARDMSIEPAPYAGLENQGATCYMNVMLQSLFHIPAFRRLVYNMPTTGTEDASKSIPLNLQRLFCRMQLSDQPCSTEALTRSFGWDTYDTIMQHDIQEFSRVLLDNLETKLKGTDLEDSISKIFRGKTRSYVRCTNVDFESSRIETFYDLSMVVQDCETLEQSFDKFVEQEKLDGANQYETEKYGKQDAIMGIEFVELPSVLQLHLSRIIYDFNYDQMVKLYTKFEFPKEIDLTKYLAKDADRSRSNVYELYGVLVHYGSVAAGHYYAFLRTSTSTEWFLFNDTQVTKSSEHKAIKDNYGGEVHLTAQQKQSLQYRYRRRAGPRFKPYSAYMLVYVRKEDAPEIFQPVPTESIPEHLRNFVEEEIEREKLEQEESERAFNEIIGTFTLEDSIKQTTLRGEPCFIQKNLKEYKFDQTSTTCKDLYDFVVKEFNKPLDEIRLWFTNTSKSPTSVVPYDETPLITQLEHYFNFHIFIEKKPKDEELEIPDSLYTVFVKFFLTSKKGAEPMPYPLQYLSSFKVNKNDQIEVLAQEISKLVKVPADHLSCYIETMGIDTQLQDLSQTFQSLFTGTILIFQVAPQYNEVDTPQFELTQFDPSFDQEHEGESKDTSFSNPLYKGSFQFSSSDSDDSSEEDKDKESKDDQTKTKKQKSKIVYDDSKLQIYKMRDLIPDFTITTYPEYSSYKNTLTKLRIIDIKDIRNPLCILEIPTKTHFPKLKRLISMACKVPYDPSTDTMLLFQGDYSNDTKPLIKPMDQCTHKSPAIFYQKGETLNMFFSIFKGVSEDQMKKLSYVTIEFVSDPFKPSLFDGLIVPKELTCDQLKEEFLKKHPECSFDGPCIYRQIYTSSSFSNALSGDKPIPYQGYTLRITLIPEDQRNLEEGDSILTVNIGTTTYYGSESINKTFTILVKKGEKYSEVKQKALEIAKFDDAKKKKLKFKFKKGRAAYDELPLKDDDEVSPHVSYDSYLFVITAEKSFQKETSIKIYN